MSDSEDELPSHYGNAASYKDGSDDDDNDDDDEEPSTSWGLKRRKRTIGIISDSDDDDDDAAEDMAKDDAETCDSDSSGGAPGAETCAICLGRMRGEVGSPDSCEHIFCKFCILEWSKNNPTCPQDRKPFSEIVVRKCLDGPIDKRIPVKKREEEAAFDIVLENPTYCEVCNECDREERLLLCDGCDLGYHLECLNPPLSEVPVEEWFCPLCTDVNAPEVLSNRRRSSVTRPTQRERRESSSSSGRIQQQSESLRIPRTRATERIRARIQRKKIKKKLKRKQQKERKKAKIESGEIEDKRPPVKSLNEFKMFNEFDADIDAIHNEDRFAEKLLAGAVVESGHRQSSHRKAAAVRRLREVAFVPQASYSGRAKNKVLEIVNTQSDDNQSDLLSGILENQAIAFSSSKKLVLTNDRKLTKQPGIEIPCKILQEEDPFLPEPLPSQKKTPERSDELEPSPNEKQEALEREKSNEDTSVDKSTDDYHGATRQQFQSRSTHVHHSERHREWRREYSHGGYSRESSSGGSSRHGEYERNRYHNRKANDHHRSRYSPYDRHSSSSWNSRSHYKHSEYGRSERHNDRHDSSDRRFDNCKNRDYSPGKKKEAMEKESRTNRSDKHDKYDENRAHSSKSHKSHSISKGKTSHSSVHGGNHHRSQWSFSYFNTDNLFSNGKSNHSVGSASNVENANDVEDVKVSSNESIKSNPVEASKDLQSDAAFADSSNINNSSQKTKSNGSHKSISGYSTIPSLCEGQESTVKVSHIAPEAGSNCVTEAGKEKDDVLLQDISCTLKLPDSNLHNSGADRLYKVNVAESQAKEKSVFKSPSSKKTKLAFLFGDTDVNDIKDKSPAKTHENEKDTNRTGREKYQKSDRKAKLKNLFTKDIDDDEHPNISAKPERETSLSKIYSNIPIASSDKNMNAYVESSQGEGPIHYSEANEEVSGKKNQGKGTHTSKPGKEVSDKHSSRKHTLPGQSKGNAEKHCGREDNSSKHTKIDCELSNDKQHVLLDNIKDVSENECHNKNDSSEKFGKEIIEDSLSKRNDSHNSSKLTEKCHDKKSSSSKHSREIKEKPSHDKKSSSRSQSLKRGEPYPTDNVIEEQKKQVSGTGHTAVDKSKLPDISYSTSESSDKKRKIDKTCTEKDYAKKERNKYCQKNKSNKGRAYGALFGDIDDIDSSSNSNLPEVEVKPIVDNSSSGASKAQVKSAVYDEDYSGKDTLDAVQLSKCLKELSSSQDPTEVNNWKQTNKTDLFRGSHSVSEHKQSCGTKPENDLRIKQQKASLEAKVVQEVKKSLDPYYRNKSITKDEYKEIVAKCVKKVVNAECGDVIEPEKMHSLAVGYIKLFKHRQIKSQP